jgi:hypothetical protein
MTATLDNTATIRELNDQCRQAWGVYPNTRVVSTQGVMGLPVEDRSAIYEKVETFNTGSPQKTENIVR